MMRLFGYSERLGSCDHCILGYHLRVYSGLTGCFGSIFHLPSGYVKIAIKMAIEIVDLPIEHGDFPYMVGMLVYHRV